MEAMHLEQNQFIWYQWICEDKNDSIISCSVFLEDYAFLFFFKL